MPGAAVSPDECSLALRGLQKLAVRLRHAETSALAGERGINLLIWIPLEIAHAF
jgi:hypothetical protein